MKRGHPWAEEEEDSPEQANGHASETSKRTPGGTRDSKKTEGRVTDRASAQRTGDWGRAEIRTRSAGVFSGRDFDE